MSIALATVAWAQTPPSGKATSPAAKKAAAPAASKDAPAVPKASPEEVLATVNGEKITRGEVVDFLSKYRIPSTVTQEEAYSLAVNSLINTKLVTQFLNKQKVQVAEQEITDTLALIETGLKRDEKTTLATKMAETGTSMAEVRLKIIQRLKWENYAKAQATDTALKRYIEENKDSINGAQVRASHILLMVDPNAPPAEKEKVKQKLLGIKKEIESGKISFADAANKYSEDPINVQAKAGGDLNYFPRKGHFIEAFSAAAFQLKKGEVSEPVETEYGFHLIQVTDKQDGQPIDLQQMRESIFNSFATDLQERVITDGRKAAKIEIKPMPDDLFQAPPTETAPGGAAPAATPTPKKAATPR
jgi:peptidyl-prolyl cis-trans isomerase C